MKACIVSASTIAKHHRMDARYYCGFVEGHDIDEAIASAEARVAAATKRLVLLCQKKQDHSQRVAKMIRDGEVRPV